ncbi:hypothetical protein protein [Bacillus cereus G9241]|nr:hypothetical protein protein [Bacillus cereus G9241]
MKKLKRARKIVLQEHKVYSSNRLNVLSFNEFG